MKTKKLTLSIFTITTIILVTVVFFASVVFAWTGPTTAAPNGNINTPINITGTSQVKSGGFWASAVGSDAGYCIGASCIAAWPTSPWTLAGSTLYYTTGSIGIGTASPMATLDINGSMRIVTRTSAPFACDAAHEGSISLTGDAAVCLCNGTSWIYDSTGAACSWPASDSTPPTVSITAPSNGATVSGNLSVTATASDNVGVVGVQFKLDGVNLSTEDTTSPYSKSWDTTTATNGAHTLTATARDAAGNTTTSTVVNVTVSNTPQDTTPPTVSITAPSNGATVSGAAVTVSATASDSSGVVGVQFKLDGVNLGAEDTTSPYSISWNTTATTNGAHTLTATARDPSANTATSVAVNVTVSNGSVVVTFTDTAASTCVVPAGWNSSNNKIEVIGPGGNGDWGPSGGGGAYSAITNVVLTPGSTVGCHVGAPTLMSITTTDARDYTYFCNSTSNCASIAGSAVIVGAEGGNDGGYCASGGSAAAGKGTTKYSGGCGLGSILYYGGGAAGMHGAGGDATASSAGAGDAGFGGAPGSGNGTEWDAAHGSGGGASGTAAGGNYGGGGGGGPSFSVPGRGGPGIIVMTYTP